LRPDTRGPAVAILGRVALEAVLSRRHFLTGTAATIATIGARRTPAGANDSYKPHEGTEKYVRGQKLAVPFTRSIDANKLTYVDIRVLESETVVTEAGPILVVYARHGGIETTGFSSSLPQDRIVVVLMDSVRRLVIQDIIPSVTSGYIPPRLIAAERQAADKAAMVELRSMVYRPLLQKEFGGHVSHPEHIVDALRSFCREHELDHKIRAIVGLGSHDENKADLRPMSKGILPFEGLRRMLLETGVNPEVFEAIGDELNQPFEFAGWKQFNVWVKESGILRLERERLIEIATTIYEGLENPRQAIERNKLERQGGSVTVWGVRRAWFPWAVGLVGGVVFAVMLLVFRRSFRK
jgi:hypothetical protein